MTNVPPARPPTQLFDWKRECPEDVAKVWPALAGGGRGRVVSTEAVEEARRKMQGRGLTSRGRPT